MNYNIKPCPFCGWDAEIAYKTIIDNPPVNYIARQANSIKTFSDVYNGVWKIHLEVSVKCTNPHCFCKIDVRTPIEERKRYVFSKSDRMRMLKDIISVWNRRA